MPPPRVWSGRGALYRLNLIVVLTMTPLTLLALLFPAWLKLKVTITWGGKVKDVWLNYGLWRHCSDVTGCRWVHDDVVDADVGGWMYPVSVLMLGSSLCQVAASLIGLLQNLLPRDRARALPLRPLRALLHRHSPATEDVAFIAGFLGTASCIIFMLSTKEKVSDGAHYHWAFALAFLASTLTLMSSLTLTKAHNPPAPTPPNSSNSNNNDNNTGRRRRHRRRSSRGERGGGRGGRGRGGSSLPRLLRVLRSEDVHLEDRPEASGGGAEGASLSMAPPRSGMSASPSPSSPPASSSCPRSESQDGSRQGGRRRQSGEAVPGPSRQRGMVRSPELENIPAAVTPASGHWPVPPQRRPRTAPVLCLEMTHLRTAPPPPPAAGTPRAGGPSAGAAAGYGPPGPAVSRAGSGGPSEDGDTLPSFSGTAASHTGSELHRTQSETVVDLPL